MNKWLMLAGLGGAIWYLMRGTEASADKSQSAVADAIQSIGAATSGAVSSVQSQFQPQALARSASVVDMLVEKLPVGEPARPAAPLSIAGQAVPYSVAETVQDRLVSSAGESAWMFIKPPDNVLAEMRANGMLAGA
jgi:hypothetical protein